MAKSKEYPDLTWVPPKSFTVPAKPRASVQLIVIHTTEGSARSTSAEDGAAYDARRTDGTSTHYFHDSDSTIQCVLTENLAHTARGEGNRRGIHHELCTTVKRAEAASWSDDYHSALLKQAAKQAARDARKWNIPIRKLSASQVAAGVQGFCGHVEVTRAFGQSTHTDPGQGFPWGRFLALVAGYANPKKEEEDVDTTTMDAIADRVVAKLMKRTVKDAATAKSDDPRDISLEVLAQYTDFRRNQILAAVAKVQATTEAVLVNVKADDSDREALAARIDARTAEIVAEMRELLADEDPAPAGQ
jgi:N-acetyl-anhydromuramyl-L-alanine amidase AmpD